MYYFDWDESKNRINLDKHGITFEEASTVFSIVTMGYFGRQSLYPGFPAVHCILSLET